MSAARAWRNVAVWSVFLIASSWIVLEGPDPTHAAFTDAEQASGTMSIAFPETAAPCLLWALGARSELRVSGSGSSYEGCLHGNALVKLVGSGQRYAGEIHYAGSLDLNAQQLLLAGSKRVPVASAPYTFDVARYRPGGAAALNAGAAFTNVAEGATLTDPADGLYHFAGSGTVRLTQHTARRLTFVAEGSLTLDLRDTDVRPYADGLLALATGSSVDVKAGTEQLRGAIYAPGARIHLTSTDLSLTGYVVGNEIDFSTQGGTFAGAAPATLS